jgi:excinuclease ABC subunit C
MHRCPGICVGKITMDEYKLHLEKIICFLQGDISGVAKDVKNEMQNAAQNKKFELAARLRDQLRSLEILEERQNVILPKKVDWDIISFGESDGYACVNLFKIRGGKLFDKENFVFEFPMYDGAAGDVMQAFLERYYLETSSRPSCVYTQSPANDPELVEHILRSRFGKKTEISSPQKGQIKRLIDLGKLNAEEYLKKWLNDKAGNLDKINKALEQLKDVLGLPVIPKRIECYDISNTQGTNPVGSMVVFADGLPAKSQYRKFKIQGKKSPDDFAMMREMLSRRLGRLADNDPKWPKPDLMVIDGGKGQLGVATEVLQTTNYQLPTIGLAKRIEEIFLPNSPQPIILGHDQPALQMLQRLRDEAHRFGITFHRKLRSKQAVKSALDEIPGVGPVTKKLLKQKFGTVGNIKKLSTDELAKVVGTKLAEKIKQVL